MFLRVYLLRTILVETHLQHSCIVHVLAYDSVWLLTLCALQIFVYYYYYYYYYHYYNYYLYQGGNVFTSVCPSIVNFFMNRIKQKVFK